MPHLTLSRIGFAFLAALLLTACSMQAMSERLIPDDVQAEIDAQTDALLRGDLDFIIRAFPEAQDSPEFREQMRRMSGNVPDGAAISRHVVGVQASTSHRYSEADGAIREGTFNQAQEIEFADGFLLVQTAHTLNPDGTCCVLRAINASRHETSPVRAGQIARARIMKALAFFVGLSTLATIVFLIIRIGGRKARAAQMGG